jgi:cell division protein FtsB
MRISGPGDAIMSPTDMEQITRPAEPERLAPAPSYSPALGPSPWMAIFQSRERRWWTIALTATLLITAFGIGVLYVDDQNNQAAIHSLTLQNESLNGRNQILNDQLKTTQTNLTATLGELAKTKAELEHPHLTIWNVPQQLKGPSWYLAGGIPDTFTYHLQASSTGPMSVSILTLEQWAKATACVDAGVNYTNYCMHHSGSVVGWLNVTSVSYDFHLAEGCADYISVFTAASPVTVTPNVSVTYAPATSATGACS